MSPLNLSFHVTLERSEPPWREHELAWNGLRACTAQACLHFPTKWLLDGCTQLSGGLLYVWICPLESECPSLVLERWASDNSTEHRPWLHMPRWRQLTSESLFAHPKVLLCIWSMMMLPTFCGKDENTDWLLLFVWPKVYLNISHKWGGNSFNVQGLCSDLETFTSEISNMLAPQWQ